MRIGILHIQHWRHVKSAQISRGHEHLNLVVGAELGLSVRFVIRRKHGFHKRNAIYGAIMTLQYFLSGVVICLGILVVLLGLVIEVAPAVTADALSEIAAQTTEDERPLAFAEYLRKVQRRMFALHALLGSVLIASGAAMAWASGKRA